MLHGLTGDGNMMMEFAKKICPKDCNLVVPDAPFKHEKRGYCWWEYSEELRKKGVVNEKALAEIQHSINFLENVVPEKGEIIIGGFSQGAAMAQIMLLSEIKKRISGMILLGTRGIKDVHLREGLGNIDPVPVLWMHGKSDEIIPFEEALILPETMLEENWDVKQIIHNRGHVIPSEYHLEVADFVEEIYSNNT
tara:strand:- start:40 stop:621 length:582 start_codon:yes stop_codon:yes gene_type:complete